MSIPTAPARRADPAAIVEQVDEREWNVVLGFLERGGDGGDGVHDRVRSGGALRQHVENFEAAATTR